MKREKGRTFITADFFGGLKVRLLEALSCTSRKDLNEIFFSIKRRNPVEEQTERGIYSRNLTYGYLTKDEAFDRFVRDNFFTGCGGIEFIEWDDSWNVVFNEQSILGGISYGMTFEEFDRLYEAMCEGGIIAPAREYEGG